MVAVANTPSSEERNISQHPAVCDRGLEWSRFPHQTAVECGSADREPSGKFTEQPKLPRDSMLLMLLLAWWCVSVVGVVVVCGVQQHTHTHTHPTRHITHNTLNTQLRRLLLGRSGKQASKTQHSAAMGKGAHWWTATSAGLNRAGFGAVELLRSSRFLLMQDSCGLSIGCDDGGVCPPLSKAVWPPH